MKNLAGKIWSAKKSGLQQSYSYFDHKIHPRNVKNKTEISAIHKNLWIFKNARIREHEYPDPGTTNIPLRWTLLTIVYFSFVKNTGDSTTINDVQNQSTAHVRVPRIRGSKRVEWDSFSANGTSLRPSILHCAWRVVNYFIKANREWIIATRQQLTIIN